MPTIWMIAIISIFVIGCEQGWKLAAAFTVLLIGGITGAVCLRAAIELWRGGRF